MDRLMSMAVFVAAADQGSPFSRAARRFGLSVSMAGKHVSAIETEFQYPPDAAQHLAAS